jgi:enoyl-CoA hydratase/carnithine racemase
VQRDPDGQIKLEQRGHLLLIGIDRPEKRNGFTPKLFNELAGAYTRLEQTPELRCGVLYAEGDHFTAGLDMPKIVPLRREGKPLLPPGEVDAFNLRPPLRTKPVVIALKGICFTVAIELMLASDVAIAAENCRFSQLEVKRGIMAGCGATFRMAERAGWGNAMKILLTGDEFTAQEGLTAQPAKVAPFAGGNGADVRKTAAGLFFQSTSGIALIGSRRFGLSGFGCRSVWR